MEYLGDEDRVAPLLHHVRPPEPEARVVFDRLLRNVRLFLSRHRVHGDLSAFNVLYHQGRPVVIDFPQAVDPRENPAAEMLLQRDVENLCRWYARSGGAADALGLSTNLWSTYLAGRLGEGGVG
jgi:RIO kinase 1